MHDLPSDIEKEDFEWVPDKDLLETDEGVCKDKKVWSAGAMIYQDE